MRITQAKASPGKSAKAYLKNKVKAKGLGRGGLAQHSTWADALSLIPSTHMQGKTKEMITTQQHNHQVLR
jgi:hypothetical protein